MLCWNKILGPIKSLAQKIIAPNLLLNFGQNQVSKSSGKFVGVVVVGGGMVQISFRIQLRLKLNNI